MKGLLLIAVISVSFCREVSAQMSYITTYDTWNLRERTPLYSFTYEYYVTPTPTPNSYTYCYRVPVRERPYWKDWREGVYGSATVAPPNYCWAPSQPYWRGCRNYYNRPHNGYYRGYRGRCHNRW